jgi:hypothetical protein
MFALPARADAGACELGSGRDRAHTLACQCSAGGIAASLYPCAALLHRGATI